MEETNIINDERIKQIYISSHYNFFGEKIKKKYQLVPYKNINEPAIFFGFMDSDFSVLNKHKSLAIIIFGGSDITLNMRNKKLINILKKDNSRCVAISNWIEKDLKKIDLKPYRIKFHLLSSNFFYPKELGKNIYVYSNGTNKYGDNIIKKLIKKLPKYNFIIADAKKYTQQKLLNIYHSCFIGLRLTTHDGNANTVQELGLCGIKCIHNGDSPNAIHWNKIEDIIEAIQNESQNIGKIDEELSNKVKEYFDINNSSPEWLSVNFYN